MAIEYLTLVNLIPEMSASLIGVLVVRKTLETYIQKKIDSLFDPKKVLTTHVPRILEKELEKQEKKLTNELFKIKVNNINLVNELIAKNNARTTKIYKRRLCLQLTHYYKDLDDPAYIRILKDRGCISEEDYVAIISLLKEKSNND